MRGSPPAGRNLAPLDDVLAEIDSLASQRVREIVTLLGQNVNGYRGENTMARFAVLVSYCIMWRTLTALSAFATTTSHPLEFSDDIIEAYAKIPKLVSHLHLPVQSGSNAIPAAMKRNHTIDIYIEQIRKPRAVRPDMYLSSDFIIGFPNETDQDFQDTLNLAKDLDFDHSVQFYLLQAPRHTCVRLCPTISI